MGRHHVRVSDAASFQQLFHRLVARRGLSAAVEVQMNYGKLRGIPWGISESAFSEIDIRRIYQYKSFGVPGLGFKQGLEEDLVVSPYSSALALLSLRDRRYKTSTG